MKQNKMQIPFWEAISIMLAVVVLVYVVVPSYTKASSENNNRYTFKVAETIQEIVNKDYTNSFSNPSILLAAAARVNPGVGVEIGKELTPGNGVLVTSGKSYACVKLSTTGAVAFSVDTPSEC